MNANFLADLKTKTEAKWAAEDVINPAVYEFQFQQGTKWNAGLSIAEIDEYEHSLGARFPNDYRAMLQYMNGTDRSNLNVYGHSDEPHRSDFTLYSYPRDLPVVLERISAIEGDRDEIAAVLLDDEQYSLSTDAVLVPVYGHRYLVCDSDPTQSRVLSIVGADVITYGMDLEGYLAREFLG